MNNQQLFFYAVIIVCAVVFVRLVNQVIRMNVEEKTKAWLYIYLLGCLASSAYITSRGLKGLANATHIPIVVHCFLLLATLCFYALFIHRHIQKIINKKLTTEIKLGETNVN